MKRVYVAGKYSADNVSDVLGNIRRGINAAAELLLDGYAVFCPFLDFQFALSDFGTDLQKEEYQANSMAWVEVSDAIYVMRDSEKSHGVQREVDRARELGIPVCYSYQELIKALK